jgi:hypothetical protein
MVAIPLLIFPLFHVVVFQEGFALKYSIPAFGHHVKILMTNPENICISNIPITVGCVLM